MKSADGQDRPPVSHQQKSAEKPSACASKVSTYFKNIMLKGEKLRCTMSEIALRGMTF